MRCFDGSLAFRFDFGDMTTTLQKAVGASRTELRLAPRGVRLTGPDKYRVLEHRRRQAQIAARRQLELL